MNFALAVLAVLQSLPVFYGDLHEDQTDRALRLGEVAEAIAHAANGNVTKAAQLLELGWVESRFASYVERDCAAGPYKCDVKHGLSRAAGYWQVWSWCEGAHDKTLDTAQRAEAGAQCAVQRMTQGLASCKTSAGAYAYYRAGGCEWSVAAERAAGQERFERKLRTELAR
jgi:hypothetical protein